MSKLNDEHRGFPRGKILTIDQMCYTQLNCFRNKILVLEKPYRTTSLDQKSMKSYLDLT